MLVTCVTKQERIEWFKMSGENVHQEIQSKCNWGVSVYLCVCSSGRAQEHIDCGRECDLGKKRGVRGRDENSIHFTPCLMVSETDVTR